MVHSSLQQSVSLLEAYLAGRIKQLAQIAETQPAERVSCEASIVELKIIQSQILPGFIKAVS